jgi:predicted PurR-regulated permease PerM
MMQSGLDVSPLVALLSLIIWSFLLGPIGALLALPLTIALRRVWQDPPIEPSQPVVVATPPLEPVVIVAPPQA